LVIIEPLTIIRIANINPAIGTPVCCNGILVVSAFKVLVELFIALLPSIFMDTVVNGLVTKFNWFTAVSVAILVTVVPATELVGVTNNTNVALEPFTRVPTFHIPYSSCTVIRTLSC
jgi:hypothetical protein